jgi:hypothetical protein
VAFALAARADAGRTGIAAADRAGGPAVAARAPHGWTLRLTRTDLRPHRGTCGVAKVQGAEGRIGSSVRRAWHRAWHRSSGHHYFGPRSAIGACAGVADVWARRIRRSVHAPLRIDRTGLQSGSARTHAAGGAARGGNVARASRGAGGPRARLMRAGARNRRSVGIATVAPERACRDAPGDARRLAWRTATGARQGARSARGHPRA